MRYRFAPALLIGLMMGTAADAATCQIITYFSDAAHQRAVGSWSSCPGQKGLQGKRTRYFETETEQIRPGPLPPRGLPCEFLVRGCRIFEPRR